MISGETKPILAELSVATSPGRRLHSIARQCPVEGVGKTWSHLARSASKFVTVYPGHIDMPDMGQDATPANDRNFTNDQLVGVFEKTEAIAKQMDRFGWDTLWLAEHHFQREGYEVLPNLLMLAVHLAHVTEKLKIGCGFNIAPMWHPLP